MEIFLLYSHEKRGYVKKFHTDPYTKKIVSYSIIRSKVGAMALVSETAANKLANEINYTLHADLKVIKHEPKE